MDSLDNFRERFEALEQQTEQLKHQTQTLEAHTHAVERRLRWRRGMACAVLVLGLLSWALLSNTAQDASAANGNNNDGNNDSDQRLAALEAMLTAVTFDATKHEVVITGANLRIVNGLGATDTTNGVGNLIVGYNEERQAIPTCTGRPTQPPCTNTRTGSHNVVVGWGLNFSSFGGLVNGELNEISGRFSSVSGGENNIASGNHSSVSGGNSRTAPGADDWAAGPLFADF
jgi:hypothetical protein